MIKIEKYLCHKSAIKMQIEFIHDNISHTRIYTTELSSYFGILGPKKCKIHCDGPSSKYKFDFYLILDIIDVIIGKKLKTSICKDQLIEWGSII